MKVKLPVQFCILVTTIVVFSAVLTRSSATSASQGPGAFDLDVSGGVATLYAVDPISQTFCFADGQPGHVIRSNEVLNRCSDIDFGNYSADSISVGIEGGRVGTIVDLGDALERYGSRGPGQVFASLQIDKGKFVIVKDPSSHSTEELAAEALFQEGKPAANVPATVGHIYVARITDRHDQKFQRIVKFMIIAHTPNQSVTMRWKVLVL
ncbi:MAG TPA: hypothetical protein VKE93_05670 [Candidatus Angelobacter sp.]|nr:hypothetical protein [Candidatus Angelobacter sp.]